MTDLLKLPMHELRRACKEKGIVAKNTDKKADLVRMLQTGEGHKEREAKRMPKLGEKKEEKALPMIPREIEPMLAELATQGLTWRINEEDGCVTFTRDLSTCANLDQPAQNILSTARQAFRSRYGARMPDIDEGNAVQAANIDRLQKQHTF